MKKNEHEYTKHKAQLNIKHLYISSSVEIDLNSDEPKADWHESTLQHHKVQ